jgi:hypothetical protein
VALPELDGDPHGQRVIPPWVEADEKVSFEVHAHDDGRVDASDIETQRVLLCGPARLASIADLQPVLVEGPAADGRGVATERVAQDADALVVRSLDAKVDGSTVRGADEQDLTLGSLDRVMEKGMHVVPTDDAVNLGI